MANKLRERLGLFVLVGLLNGSLFNTLWTSHYKGQTPDKINCNTIKQKLGLPSSIGRTFDYKSSDPSLNTAERRGCLLC